jgi:hypothetical protein
MIHLELKVEEAQLVLNALSQLPFAQVASLIANIRAQAEKQLQPATSAPADTATTEKK